MAYASFAMKKKSQFTEHFNYILNGLKATGNLDVIMKMYPIRSNFAISKCNIPSTKNSTIGFEKLTFLFFILIIGMILSLIVIILEFKIKLDRGNGEEEFQPSFKEIDDLENKTRRLLEGPLKERTEKCLKRLLDEYTLETKSYTARQLTYMVKSETGPTFTIW